MTTVRALYDYLNEIAPFSLAERWDNVGLLIGGADQTVSRAAVALDVTLEVAEEAARQGVDCIVSHHPVIFSPIKRIGPQDTAYRLIQKGIAVISAHTNLDIAWGGVCDVLAECLGVSHPVLLEETGRERFYKVVAFVPASGEEAVRTAMEEAGAGTLGNYSRCSFTHPGTGRFLPLDGAHPALGQPGVLEQAEEVRIEMICPADRLTQVLTAMRDAHPYEEPAYDVFQTLGVERPYGLGRIGELERPFSPQDLAQLVRDRLDCGAVKLIPGRKQEIRRVALANGAEAGLLSAALKAGAEALVAGEVKHNVMIDARNAGITLIDAGHFDTEHLIVPRLEQKLRERFPQIELASLFADRRPYTYI